MRRVSLISLPEDTTPPLSSTQQPQRLVTVAVNKQNFDNATSLVQSTDPPVDQTQNRLRFPKPLSDSGTSIDMKKTEIEMTPSEAGTEASLLNMAVKRREKEFDTNQHSISRQGSLKSSGPRPLGAGAIPIGGSHKITLRNSLSTVNSPPNSPPSGSTYLPQSLFNNKPQQRPASTLSNPVSPVSSGLTTKDANPFFAKHKLGEDGSPYMGNRTTNAFQSQPQQSTNPRVRRTIRPYSGAKSDGLVAVNTSGGSSASSGNKHAFISGSVIAAAERRQRAPGFIASENSPPKSHGRATTQDLLLTLSSTQPGPKSNTNAAESSTSSNM